MKIPHCVYPLTHGGHVGCFHLLAIIKGSTLNISAHLFEFFHLQWEFLGDVVILCFTFWGTTKLFAHFTVDHFTFHANEGIILHFHQQSKASSSHYFTFSPRLIFCLRE